ncbi:hypothetical protein [Neorhodopirellula pilleata]|uniref:Uncharacterized protein n=1 Tax=Neorhodopirellula pilleata TaxID=2714738 RepID=A0A5C5ZQN6_9BACT|nr:hypothetical protein [Neorhodopirellula pilleata]TWT89378.1 hypothetical protein Pla100_55410 [Neorhodopirellula pilleata]
MHERTTRAIARWLFVACCALPTALTLVAIVVTWTPWYESQVREQLQRELALQTGLDVKIGRFERSNPQTWRLYDVQLSDGETMQTIATVRSLCWISESPTTVIRLSQPEIRVESLDRIASLVHDRFLCRPEQTRHAVRIAADDLTLRGSTVSQTIRDLDAHLTPQGPRVSISVRCVPAEGELHVEGLNAHITRDRSTSPPTTAWSLQTGPMALNVATLSDYLPFLRRFGDDATFSGLISGHRQDGLSQGFGPPPWAIDLTGRFDQVDLGRLTEELPHRVTGRATLAFSRCRLDRSDAEGGVNVSGELRSGTGWMSASLLPRLAEDLGCELTAVTATDFSYDALALRFELYAAQLRVEGICRTQPGQEWLPAGVVVSAAGRPVVVSADQWLPATNLARLVASPHSVSIPLSSQTAGLLQILQPPRQTLPQMISPNGESLVPAAADANPTEPAARIGRLQPWSDQPRSIAQPF